ncbi:unnamed protein product [Prorocentrum cordatum]|uniref:Uncharacterized protein n=1 Tax=Prorocentrum cordatum TaxID=2364126 RepID=A0ABN9U7S8_9DINO|nr:unnamed protein product [Polarella glacialis]
MKERTMWHSFAEHWVLYYSAQATPATLQVAQRPQLAGLLELLWGAGRAASPEAWAAWLAAHTSNMAGAGLSQGASWSLTGAPWAFLAALEAGRRGEMHVQPYILQTTTTGARTESPRIAKSAQ